MPEHRPRILGWCNDGKHSECRYEYVTVHTNETRRCECPHHNQEEA